MAILSKGITLSYSNSAEGTYTDLTDLLEIPALGATPEKVDVTTLADGNKKYINGIVDFGDLSFKFNYAKAQFDTLKAITAKTYFKVTLPAETQGGSGTTASFSGVPSVALEGVGVGSPITYTLSIAIDSDITFA